MHERTVNPVDFTFCVDTKCFSPPVMCCAFPVHRLIKFVHFLYRRTLSHKTLAATRVTAIDCDRNTATRPIFLRRACFTTCQLTAASPIECRQLSNTIVQPTAITLAIGKTQSLWHTFLGKTFSSLHKVLYNIVSLL